MARDIALENMQSFARKGARLPARGFISTGHFRLDFAINNGFPPDNVNLDTISGYDPRDSGGIRRGIAVEVYGEEGSGKSSLAYRLVGMAQKQGLKAFWVDSEFSFSEDLAEINGVNLDDIYLMDEAGITAEQIFDRLYIAIEKGGMNVIVVDSVASMVPAQVMEKSTEQDTMAALARVMSKAMPKLMALIAKHNVLVIFINQLREKPGVMFGDPTTTPGGRALKFYSHLRLQVVKRMAKDAEVYIEDEHGVQQLIAQQSLVYIRKNRFARALRESIAIPIYFQPYFPNPEDLAFELGRQLKIIGVREGVFKWGDLKVEGKGAFIQAVKTSSLTAKLIDEVKVKAKTDGVILPPELMTFEIVKTKSGDEPTEATTEDDGETPTKVQRGRKKKDSGPGPENSLD